MELSCIIVDDEPLAVQLLESFVKRTPYLRFVASYTDPVLALSELSKQPVDLLFLDIQMPDLEGLNLSRMVPPETRVIFATAFKEYAFDSYEVNALDFLLKPIRYHKFLQAAEKARQWFELQEQARESQQKEAERESLFVRMEGELKRIDVNSILYVAGLKDYVVLYLDDEPKGVITHDTMKAMEEMLPVGRFMRVHRSYIVALDKIRKVDRNNCIYIGKEIIHSHTLVRQEEPHLTAALQTQRDGTKLICPVIVVAAALVHEVAFNSLPIRVEQMEYALFRSVFRKLAVPLGTVVNGRGKSHNGFGVHRQSIGLRLQ